MTSSGKGRECGLAGRALVLSNDGGVVLREGCWFVFWPILVWYACMCNIIFSAYRWNLFQNKHYTFCDKEIWIELLFAERNKNAKPFVVTYHIPKLFLVKCWLWVSGSHILKSCLYSIDDICLVHNIFLFFLLLVQSSMRPAKLNIVLRFLLAWHWGNHHNGIKWTQVSGWNEFCSENSFMYDVKLVISTRKERWDISAEWARYIR